MSSENKKANHESFRPIVGIDLGTTNSAVAYIHNGKPEIIPAENGEHLVPSVVLIDPNGKVIVGEDARSALIAMPERTKAAVKREMGEKEPILLSGKEYSPEEISAFILRDIKQSVDQLLGEGEKEAVITVPAYFTDEQRQATKRAGELAGFVVERIINEPTAAALAFGLQHLKNDGHVLVYDLGGGTFDVSVVEMMDGILEVKASTGNSHLGGEDFDWLLVDWMAEQINGQTGVDPRKDIRGKALLKEEAERIKIQLSVDEEAEISLPVVMMQEDEPVGLYTNITRSQFVALIEAKLTETEEKVTQVLEDASLKRDEIDEILLVGGSTKIPRVRALIENYFDKAPRTDVHPDEAVALGAAVQAGLKSGALSDSGMIVTDVAPFSMGIAVLKNTRGTRFRPGGFQAIIPRNTTIPVTRTERFGTTADNQTAVSVEIYQGEHEWVKDNHYLNEFLLDGLPPNRAGDEQVDVTFRYNLNGILEVTAKSVSTEKSMSVTVQDALDRGSEQAFQESLEKVESMYNEEDELEVDEDLLDLLEDDGEEGSEFSLAELKEEAQQWRKRCESSIKEASAEIRDELKEIIESLNEALETNDPEQLEEAIDEATDLFIDLEF